MHTNIRAHKSLLLALVLRIEINFVRSTERVTCVLITWEVWKKCVENLVFLCTRTCGQSDWTRKAGGKSSTQCVCVRWLCGLFNGDQFMIWLRFWFSLIIFCANDYQAVLLNHLFLQYINRYLFFIVFREQYNFLIVHIATLSLYSRPWLNTAKNISCDYKFRYIQLHDFFNLLITNFAYERFTFSSVQRRS